MSQKINIDNIYVREKKLRDAQVDDPEYINLRESVKQYGVCSAFILRHGTNPEGEQVFELVDGMQRLSICKELGIKEVPYTVIENADEERALVVQFIANANRVEPKKAQYANQIQRLLEFDKTLTVNSLSIKLNKSPATLKAILQLVKLTPKAQALVDEGQICLANARALSKMPATEQDALIPDAVKQQPEVFVTQLAEMARQMKAAAQQGERPVAVFNDKPALRKMSEIVEFMENRDNVAQLIEGVTNPYEAARLAFQYCLSTDPLTLAARKADWEAKQAAAKAKVEAAREERKKKKEAAETVAA